MVKKKCETALTGKLGERFMRNRKLNRLKNYDYSEYGFYFVTICAHNHIEYFGKIENNAMILNFCGEIAKQQWFWLHSQYSYLKLDAFIIMPNHVHGIIVIENNPVGTGRDLSLQYKIKSLSELIGAFKTTSSKLIRLAGLKDFQWQRSFYDHVIRNEQSLKNIREYIVYNHLKWAEDIENKRGNGNIKNYYDKITCP